MQGFIVSTTDGTFSAKQQSTVGPQLPCSFQNIQTTAVQQRTYSSGHFRPPPPPAAHLPHDSNTHHQSWPQHDIASLQEHQTANSMKPELPTTWLQPTPSICSHTLTNPEEGLLLHACSTAPVHTAPPAHFYMRLSTVGGILLS